MDEIRTCRLKTYDTVWLAHGSDPFFYTWIFFVNMILVNLLMAMVTHGTVGPALLRVFLGTVVPILRWRYFSTPPFI